MCVTWTQGLTKAGLAYGPAPTKKNELARADGKLGHRRGAHLSNPKAGKMGGSTDLVELRWREMRVRDHGEREA